MSQVIQSRIEGGIAHIEMADGPANILGLQNMRELYGAISDADSCGLLVLSSTTTHFSKGVDIKIHTPELVPKMLSQFHDIIRKLYGFPGITICMLHGYALGGGMELALSCDFVFAEAGTILGFPEIRLACYPPVAAVLLPRLIGRRALRLLYTGQEISAEEALRIGLVDSVFAEAARAEFLKGFLQQMSLWSKDALAILKKVVRETAGFDFEKELEKAEQYYKSELLKSPDPAEGVAAFLQKRQPRYR